MSNPLALVIKSGSAVAVLRPADPEKALELVEKGLNDQESFDAILTEQDYTFVGLLRRDMKIVNSKTRKPVDRVKPGDSFVRWTDLRKAHERGEVEVRHQGQAR